MCIYAEVGQNLARIRRDLPRLVSDYGEKIRGTEEAKNMLFEVQTFGIELEELLERFSGVLEEIATMAEE